MTINGFIGVNRWLSNYEHSPVLLDGLVYPTIEHAFQAAKTFSLTDREKIRHCRLPKEARQMGRTVSLRPGWDGMRLEVMEGLLRQKFEHDDLRARLLETGDQELVENNWWGDKFWGVSGGVGENHLGKLLMKIRSELKEKP
ncbi:NADAR [uncultured Caudovirales phage]|uniref:NADAR n=1 Tax=uncultured Caudovirales phage TaxID=2100421 RepID=A0A6J5L662_9CAUD|nr:NADAR [uncultured Caudovirales phage]